MKSPGEALQSAFARHRKGDVAAAEKIYRKVIKAQPGNADALYLLGNLYLEGGRAADSVRYLKLAIRTVGKAGRREDPGWRLALGAALQRAGNHDAALAEFDSVLHADPASLDAMFCRATALQDLGRTNDAVTAYKSVLASAPKHAEAANNLGAIHRERGEPAAAAAAFRRAVEARPEYVEALCNLGRTLADLGREAEAVAALLAGVEAHPDDMELHLVLLDCLLQAGRAGEAERRARAFLAAHPDSAPVLAALGSALQFLGRRGEAREVFLSAVSADPGCYKAHQGLADDREEAGRETHLKAIRSVLQDTGSKESPPSGLYYALARHLSAAGRHEESLEAHASANALKRKVLSQRGFAYDRERVAERVDALCAAFPADLFEAPGASDSARPLFILGMPRSGTTLVEQILASHPEVFGAGELDFMGRIVDGLHTEQAYPGAPVAGDALEKAAAFYLGEIGRLDGEASRVTDKMPGNFMHLGLIARILPNARIVHTRRNPMDTCLSCFTQNFRAANLSWCLDMEDLGHYYCQYRRLMGHWRQVLPEGSMLEVDYEDTVADAAAEARRIVTFAGLDWDDACLRFYEAERPVATSSHSQVRREVYSDSVGRWKRYGDGVAPLARALAACGCGPGGEQTR